MKMSKLAWLILGTSVVTAGAVAAACSSDPAPLPGSIDNDATTNNPDGNTTDDGGTTTQDGGDGSTVNCTAKLRPLEEAGPFCPFVPRGPEADAGRGRNCATLQTCCNGQVRAGDAGDAGFDDSVCADGGATACPTPSNPARIVEAFECAEPNDCAGGKKCCIIGFADGGKPGLGKDKFTCTILKAENGSRCKDSCDTALDYEGCQDDSQCGGKKCVSVKVGSNDGIQMGYCE